MIRTGISVGLGSERELERALDYARRGYGLQLSFFRRNLLYEFGYKALEELAREGLLDRLLAIHLPLKASVMINNDNEFLHWLSDFSAKADKRVKYVIHPNDFIKNAAAKMFDSGIEQKICIENFFWKRKKKLRSIFEIIEFGLNYPQAGVCWDTSHTERNYFYNDQDLCTYFISHILPSTDIIHLSNRKDKDGHRPFNDSTADLPLVWLVNNLIPMFKWDGVIILEYMAEHKHKLVKNLKYLNELLEKSIKK